jgi:SAM-dependent methyltransferase
MASEPVIGDAFGAMLKAAHDGEPAAAAIERDDGLSTAHDPQIYFTPPAAWPVLEQEACARTSGRVVDVGCGAGRHSLALQNRGLVVTGIDVSAGACAVSAARGVLRVQQLDVQAVGGKEFDTLLMLGSTFGLLGSPEHAPSVLHALARSAAPGARLLGTGGFSETDDPDHSAYHQRNRARGRPPGALRIRTRFGNLADPWIELWLFTPDELAALLHNSPWRIERLDGQPSNFLAELRLR